MAKEPAEVTGSDPLEGSDFEAVIGLEVHAQLLTATKAFCACSPRFGDPPNTNTCPVCLALPGALPVLNSKALELALRASIALNCEVQERSRFARKNYFYPDLPKGYQISMYELPLATSGWLEFRMSDGPRHVRITRVHMEEDAAKNLHEGFNDSDRYSYIDFNRCGAPLIEIVSEPDLRTPAEAHAYLTALKRILLRTKVSNCNMEEGSLRCDANVSVRLRGAEKFGTKVEVKNLNSFRFLQRALEHEIERQIGVIESGGTIPQETRLYDSATGRTEPMRSKEFAHDYRYFPDPDLVKVHAPRELQALIRAQMPELPAVELDRFVTDYDLSSYDAGVLTSTTELADYFEATVRAGARPKAAANWISTILLGKLNEAKKPIAESAVTPEDLAEIIASVESGVITAAAAKKILAEVFETGLPAGDIIAKHRSSQVVDGDELVRTLMDTLMSNLPQVQAWARGKTGLEQYFLGQVMRSTSGRANLQTLKSKMIELNKLNSAAWNQIAFAKDKAPDELFVLPVQSIIPGYDPPQVTATLGGLVFQIDDRYRVFLRLITADELESLRHKKLETVGPQKEE